MIDEEKEMRIDFNKVLIALIILFLIFFFFFVFKLASKADIESGKEAKEEIEVKTDFDISMVMVGDALIHESIYLSNKIDTGYNFDSMLSRIKPIVESYDIAYYNQETVLGGSEIGLSTYPRFNSPYEVGDAFINAGFNMVSLANNHTLDRGKNAIVNSINYWKSKENVLTSGSYLSEEDRIKDNIFVKNNISYTMLSYTTHTNGISIPGGESYLVNVYNPDKVREDIERVRSKVDVLIVAMHWGNEYNNYPVQSQRTIAEYLSSLGVDIIIGSHPHVVEPVSFINNTLVIYSLGNAVSSQNGANNRTGLMMSLNIHKHVDNDNSTITIENPTARLIYTHYREGSPRYEFTIYPYDELNNNILNNYEGYYDQFMGIVTSESNKIEKYPLYH